MGFNKKIKNVIRRLARRLGYRVVKLKPFATLNSIQMALAYFVNVRPGAVFVQIGACDGTSGDPVHEFIMRGTLRSVLVEPIGYNFQKLQTAYKDAPNVSLVRAALGREEGSVPIYCVKNEGRWKDSESSRQWASFDKWRILKHDVREEEIEEDVVPSVTLSSLMSKFSLPRINVLQIDTEGFDRHIVQMALDLVNPPECIGFEFIHMTHQQLADLMESLTRRGYVWNFDDQNAVAVHEDLFREWTGNARP